jgi:hypothetical protein
MPIITGSFIGIGELPRVDAAMCLPGGLSIRVTFSEPILVNDALLNPSSYELVSLDPESVIRSIINIAPIGSGSVTEIDLGLDGKLTIGEQNYQLTVISSNITDEASNPIDPDNNSATFDGLGLPKELPLVVDPAVQQISPVDPIPLFLRSSSQVIIGDLNINLGYSGIQLGDETPDKDQKLKDAKATVVIESAERVRPIVAGITALMHDNALRLIRGTDDETAQGLYEVSARSVLRAPCLGYIKFKVRNDWSVFSPYWCDQNNMTGVYLALESGSLQTAGHAFIKKEAGVGSIVVGGPIGTAYSPRPAQEIINCNIFDVAPGEEVELFLYFNMAGLPVPYFLPNVPLFEVWCKKPADSAPEVLTRIPLEALGAFSESSVESSNYRPHATDEVRFIFGNVGKYGDILDITDWALVPESRAAVVRGHSVDGHELTYIPDAPRELRAERGLISKQTLGTWELLEGPTAHTKELPRYQPGNLDYPFAISIQKSADSASGFFKEESRLTEDTGFLLEGVIYGQEELDASPEGSLEADDGHKIYRVTMIDASQRTYGIRVQEPQKYEAAPGLFDYRSPKMVRIYKDFYQDRAVLELDDVRVSSVDIEDLPESSGSPKVLVGFPEPTNKTAELNLRMLRYLPNFHVYDSSHGAMPDEPPYSLVKLGDGFTELLNTGVLEVSSLLGSRLVFVKTVPFFELGGFLIDFEFQVTSYRGSNGERFRSMSKVGAGLTVQMGGKKIEMCCYDCGVHGRKLGILPYTENEQDIIKQTAIGKKYSVNADWTKPTRVRVLLKGGHSLRVWVGSTATDPSISLDWFQHGFDLPPSAGAPGFTFGHLFNSGNSVSEWKSVRWGNSTGYDTTIKYSFPNGFRPYHFGGRAFIVSEFGET